MFCHRCVCDAESYGYNYLLKLESYPLTWVNGSPHDSRARPYTGHQPGSFPGKTCGGGCSQLRQCPPQAKELMMNNHTGTCRGCGAPIIWKRTRSGKWTPEDPDGKPHWATCPKSKDFKRKLDGKE